MYWEGRNSTRNSYCPDFGFWFSLQLEHVPGPRFHAESKTGLRFPCGCVVRAQSRFEVSVCTMYFVWATIHLGILKFKFRPDCAQGRVFFSEFLYGGDPSLYEYGEIQISALSVSQSAVKNSSWFGRKKLAKFDFQQYCDYRSTWVLFLKKY